jgi:hypothetical protein
MTVATATSTAVPRRAPPFHQPDIVFSLACLTSVKRAHRTRRSPSMKRTATVGALATLPTSDDVSR